MKISDNIHKSLTHPHFHRGYLGTSLGLLILCGFALTMTAGAPRNLPGADKTGSPKAAADVATTTSPLPYDMASQASLKGSTKKVFAHYFTPFPISLDNKVSTSDFYTNGYLNPNGESGKHVAYGGFLRERPLPRPVDPSPNWQLNDMKTEVSRATNAGLDGFTIDVLSITSYNWDRLNYLVQAASQVDGNFKIMLMPDSNASATNDAAALATALAGLANGPYGNSLYRLNDGRLVVSPFYAEKKGAAFWQTFITEMQSRGVQVAFVPCFLNYSANVAAFDSFSYGFSNWGSRSPATNQNLAANNNDSHNRGKIWMQPVSLQDERPNQSVYDEANNTENFRTTWNAAINNNSDWVQIPTWNDYSEGAEISPSSHIGWSPLDINYYFLHRFKLGSFPTIKRDVIYISHRTQPYAATPTFGETSLMKLRAGSSPSRDNVEALSFLTAATDVTLTTGGAPHTYTAPAGMSAQSYPLALGQVTASINYASGAKRILTSPFAITANPYVQDLQYYFVSSSRDGSDVAAPVQTQTPQPAQSTSQPAASNNQSQSTGQPSSGTPTSTTNGSTIPAGSVPSPGSTVALTVNTTSNKPLTVSGNKLVITPSAPGSVVSVKVDGEDQASNTVNTELLTNGVHTLTITDSKSGKTVTQKLIVQNSTLQNAGNHVRAHPVAYGSSLIIVSAVASIVTIRYHLVRYLRRRFTATHQSGSSEVRSMPLQVPPTTADSGRVPEDRANTDPEA